MRATVDQLKLVSYARFAFALIRGQPRTGSRWRVTAGETSPFLASVFYGSSLSIRSGPVSLAGLQLERIAVTPP